MEMEKVRSEPINVTEAEGRFVFDLIQSARLTGGAAIITAGSIFNKIKNAFDFETNGKGVSAENELILKYCDRVTVTGAAEIAEITELINMAARSGVPAQKKHPVFMVPDDVKKEVGEKK